MSHPLDNEEIAVTVTLVHIPTGQRAEAYATAPADAAPSVAVATTQALELAEDMLLDRIETQGG